MAVRLDFDFGMKVCENVNSGRLDEMLGIICKETGVKLRKFENKVISVLGYLQNVSERTPLYFVDDKLMDLLSSNIRMKSISEECLRDMIARRSTNVFPNESIKEHASKFPLLEDARECIRENHSKIDAIGIFIPSCPSFGSEYDEILKGLEYPSIFISPEKVISSAKSDSSDYNHRRSLLLGKVIRSENNGIRISSLFKMVLFHELGHAYLYSAVSDTRNHGALHYYIIEESFANAVAFDRFYQCLMIYKKTNNRYDPADDLSSLVRFTKKQPLEYRGWHIFFSLAIDIMGYTNSEFRDMISRLESIFLYKGVMILGRKNSEVSPGTPWGVFDPVVFKKMWMDEKVDDNFFKALAEFILEDICV